MQLMGTTEFAENSRTLPTSKRENRLAKPPCLIIFEESSSARKEFKSEVAHQFEFDEYAEGVP
jgi:hypothetical protein